ncbi:MAG: septal ring lytic transglycosylase RlpA family protein [Steroidobacteraceae bacterium]|jgi:rare lipoprotein A|nr:septal ring lytic transglycosylase RlpA family protein [Steroidobacteraceae bacterium]
MSRLLRGAAALALALPWLACGVEQARAQATIAPGTGAEPAAATANRDAAPASAAAVATRDSGTIAWYGRRFAGRRTASGERFDPAALTMAHRTLPFGTRVRITDGASGKSVVVRVNDRGPTQADRIGDVSLAAARELGMVRRGLAQVQLEVLGAD